MVVVQGLVEVLAKLEHIADGLEGVGLAEAGSHLAEEVEGLVVVVQGLVVLIAEAEHIADGLEGVGPQEIVPDAQVQGAFQPPLPGRPATVDVVEPVAGYRGQAGQGLRLLPALRPGGGPRQVVVGVEELGGCGGVIGIVPLEEGEEVGGQAAAGGVCLPTGGQVVARQLVQQGVQAVALHWQGGGRHQGVVLQPAQQVPRARFRHLPHGGRVLDGKAGGGEGAQQPEGAPLLFVQQFVADVQHGLHAGVVVQRVQATGFQQVHHPGQRGGVPGVLVVADAARGHVQGQGMAARQLDEPFRGPGFGGQGTFAQVGAQQAAGLVGRHHVQREAVGQFQVAQPAGHQGGTGARGKQLREVVGVRLPHVVQNHQEGAFRAAQVLQVGVKLGKCLGERQAAAVQATLGGVVLQHGLDVPLPAVHPEAPGEGALVPQAVPHVLGRGGLAHAAVAHHAHHGGALAGPQAAHQFLLDAPVHVFGHQQARLRAAGLQGGGRLDVNVNITLARVENAPAHVLKDGARTGLDGHVVGVVGPDGRRFRLRGGFPALLLLTPGAPQVQHLLEGVQHVLPDEPEEDEEAAGHGGPAGHHLPHQGGQQQGDARHDEEHQKEGAYHLVSSASLPPKRLSHLAPLPRCDALRKDSVEKQMGSEAKLAEGGSRGTLSGAKRAGEGFELVAGG